MRPRIWTLMERDVRVKTYCLASWEDAELDLLESVHRDLTERIEMEKQRRAQA